MYIEDCIWLPDILVKLFVKHNVTQKEVEEIFFNRPKYRFVESGYRKGKMCIPLLDRQILDAI